jgi:hypothetical protein
MFHVKHFCKVFGAATTQGLVGLCSGIEQILLIGRAAPILDAHEDVQQQIRGRWPGRRCAFSGLARRGTAVQSINLSNAPVSNLPARRYQIGDCELIIKVQTAECHNRLRGRHP